MGTNAGFGIVYDRGASVVDVDVTDGGQKSENNSGIAFPIIRTEHWEKTFSRQDVRGETQNSFEQVKVPPKAYEPTKEKPHISSFPCLVRGLRQGQEPRRRKHETTSGHGTPCNSVRLHVRNGHLGDPNRKISMMVATDSIHGSIFAVVARRKGGQEDYVMHRFQNYVERLGLVEM